jgi:hypothetical protein
MSKELFKYNGNTSGKVDDVFTKDEIIYFVNHLSILPGAKTISDGNKFTGIDANHQLYNWFNRKIFTKVQNIFGDHVRLLFGSYLNEIAPWTVHSDYYSKAIGEPYMAFLIPLSVNNNIELADQTNTIVFNEIDTYVDVSPKDKTGAGSNWMQNESIKENNAMPYYEKHLSHLTDDQLQRVTVQNVLNWKLGSVIYWDEKLLHSSDNFLANNLKSKQAIVMHTYVV